MKQQIDGDFHRLNDDLAITLVNAIDDFGEGIESFQKMITIFPHQSPEYRLGTELFNAWENYLST